MSTAASRKRRRTTSQDVSQEEEEFRTLSSRDPQSLTKEERKRLRAIKNRRSAQRSRDRVRNELDALKTENASLHAHIAKLTALLTTHGVAAPPPPSTVASQNNALFASFSAALPSSPSSPMASSHSSPRQRAHATRAARAACAAPASRLIASTLLARLAAASA